MLIYHPNALFDLYTLEVGCTPPRKASLAMPKNGRPGYRVALAGGLVMALLLSTTNVAEAVTLSSPAQTPSPTAKPQPVAERPDRVSAALTARLQGSRVLVTGETTETTLTYINPDATTTLEASSGPVRVKQGDAWTPIDTTLVAQNGTLKPKASLADIEFSAGADGKPLAFLERSEKQSYALTWPVASPAPNVEGNKATYTDAAGPGAALVLTALPNEFRHDIVLRERPNGPVEYRIPIQAKGLPLAETDQGGLKLTDTKGKTIASAPPPVIYNTPTPDRPGSTSTAPQLDRHSLEAEVVSDGEPGPLCEGLGEHACGGRPIQGGEADGGWGSAAAGSAQRRLLADREPCPGWSARSCRSAGRRRRSRRNADTPRPRRRRCQAGRDHVGGDQARAFTLLLCRSKCVHLDHDH
ncbi:hypothetical protein AB0J71_48895 [Nonomuraea sp. NPDC049637]|uniref:hypothetical protein n=1 Tax=Nonomuraea sp. NPDC049637 TaxID=3154356 RepID=UPI003423C44F